MRDDSQRRRLTDAAFAWLAGREDRPEWAHVLQKLLDTVHDDAQRRRLIDAAFAWLAGREDRPEWNYVLEKLLDTVEDDVTLARVVEIARSWLVSDGARPNRVHVRRRLRALEARRGTCNDALDHHIAGSVVVGRVTRVMRYGVWFNVQGITGLLHASQVPRRKADELERHYEVGQFHRVEVVAINHHRGRLELAHLGDDGAVPE